MIERSIEPDSLRAWAKFLRQIRIFFDERNFTEVTTDHIVAAGAFEAVIDPLSVSLGAGSAELHTSPEMEMKVLLAKSELPIYQICRCFRDDPPTGVHLREFTMLEFYRPGATYVETREDMRALFRELSGQDLEMRQATVEELVRQYSGLELRQLSRRDSFARALFQLGIESTPDDDWQDLFFRLMIDRIEPNIDPAVPLLLYDYPLPIAALSRRSPSQEVAEKFEIYWKGMELCNGCTELGDAEELAVRFQNERTTRKNRGLSPHPYPSRLFESVAELPKPSSGVAVGLDRLFACLYPSFIVAEDSLRE